MLYLKGKLAEFGHSLKSFSNPANSGSISQATIGF